MGLLPGTLLTSAPAFVVSAWVLLGVAALLEARLPARPPAEAAARARLVWLAALVLAAVVTVSPSSPAATRVVERLASPQVWAGVGSGAATPTLEVVAAPASAGVSLRGALIGLVWGAVGVGLGLLLWDLARLAWALRDVVGVRRIGRVRVGVSARAAAPFAVHTGRWAWVVLDVETWGQPDLARVAITHELQHHRQRDPSRAWALALVHAALGPVPPVRAWARRLAEHEELACDAACAPRTPGGLPAYARALLSVAGRAAPALVPALPRTLVARRIHMLLSPPAPRSAARSTVGTAFSLLALTLFAPLTGALAGPAAPGGGLAERAATVAARANSRAGHSADDFVLVANDAVVEKLERAADSPELRAWLDRALASRGETAALVDGALAQAGLPPELAAVPIVESGYTNWGAPDVGRTGSLAPGQPGRGLWMFIPATARAYGLRVDDVVDQRFDLALETQAAVALFTDLHASLGDWPLAIAAYNQGERAVRAAMDGQGTRDAWALARSGALNDYLAQVMTAALLLEEPSLLGR